MGGSGAGWGPRGGGVQVGAPLAKWAERGGKRDAGGSAGGSCGVHPRLALALAQRWPHTAPCPPRRTLPRVGEGGACWLELEGPRTLLLRLAGGCTG